MKGILPWDTGLVSFCAARKHAPDRVPGPRDPQHRDLGSILGLGSIYPPFCSSKVIVWGAQTQRVPRGACACTTRMHFRCMRMRDCLRLSACSQPPKPNMVLKAYLIYFQTHSGLGGCEQVDWSADCWCVITAHACACISDACACVCGNGHG